ncbi:MAG: hypothetical protein V4529_14175 [Gemmatimonadota bacterium]
MLDTCSGSLSEPNCLGDVNQRTRGRHGPIRRDGVHGIRAGACDAAENEGSLALRLSDSHCGGLPFGVSKAAQDKRQRSFEPEEDYADYDECDDGFDEDKPVT